MDLKTLLGTQWDRATAIGCTVAGALLLLIGWIGVSGTPFLAEQAPYIISGGVGGMFLLGVGATLWISADLRDEWRKLDRIEAALVDGTLRYVEDDASQALPQQRPRPEATVELVEVDEVVRPVARTARTTAGVSEVTPRARSKRSAGIGHA